ncbi:LPS assembly lipoprotein LptE [Kordiimonas laminariae]|uniref:LPS assembly lipoprotein LptE n=1 Tax=Kordiimonas laminariae TaxID=2917717 RepID=UPI001FF517A1|nr:LPS assembly lipoprotein LptE [Kordiimonas laminariae]MCK0070180.1 LPS assembly lipoprotein LptE [Kordiimonas laminariae]
MMRLIAVFSLFLLTACGFKPLYEVGGSSAALQAQFSQIEVAPIPDRLGQVMRNRLLDRLNSSGNKYRLEVVLEQSSEQYGTRPDTAKTQEQLTMFANVKLISFEGAEPKVVIEERMRARTSFDVVQSDFAAVAQREDSAERLALEMAERIQRRLALYFSQAN